MAISMCMTCGKVRKEIKDSAHHNWCPELSKPNRGVE